MTWRASGARATGAQGVIDVQNPNASGAKHMKAKDMTSEPTVELSRREREELEKQRSKEDYERRHKEGKTDEFKKDMERLQQAKKRREEEEAKRASVAKANEEAQSRAKASTAAGATNFKKLFLFAEPAWKGLSYMLPFRERRATMTRSRTVGGGMASILTGARVRSSSNSPGSFRAHVMCIFSPCPAPSRA